MDKMEKNKGWRLIERSVKQLNTYGNGIGVLVTREAKSLGMKAGDRVQVSSVQKDGKEVIVIERFPEELEK